MAKDLEKNVDSVAEKTDKKAEKLAAKKEKAEAKKAELAQQIADLREQISAESDEKVKDKLRKQRDELIDYREAITKSKDGMTIPMPNSTKKAIKSVIAVVLVIALLAAYVTTGTAKHGLLSFFGVPQSTITAAVIENKDGEKHSIKVSTYNYYFAMFYNNLRNQQGTYSQYGLDLSSVNLDVDFDKKFSQQKTKNDDDKEVTWAEYAREETLESIKSTYTYYFEAVKANNGKEPKITEDQEKELKETLDSYEETAKGYGYTLSAYITAAMGKGVTLDVFKREAKIAYIAQNYQQDYNKELLKKEYDEADYKQYLDEHKDELVSVSVKIFECDNEDDAAAFNKALKSDGSNFAELAAKYSTDSLEKQLNKSADNTIFNDITKATLSAAGHAIATANDEGKTPGLDWLFSSKRKAGDKKQYSTTVVYVLRPVKLSNVKTVNVRHILVSPSFDAEEGETVEPTEATAAQWKAAKKQADKILKEFKSGDKKAASFGKLAKEYTEDSNGNDGGLYENVTPNQMVPTFGNWCFDSARKAGDTAIIRSKFGYHIMYFEGKGDLKTWEYTAQQALAGEDSEVTLDALEKGYKIKENLLGKFFYENDTDIDS